MENRKWSYVRGPARIRRQMEEAVKMASNGLKTMDQIGQLTRWASVAIIGVSLRTLHLFFRTLTKLGPMDPTRRPATGLPYLSTSDELKIPNSRRFRMYFYPGCFEVLESPTHGLHSKKELETDGIHTDAIYIGSFTYSFTTTQVTSNLQTLNSFPNVSKS